MQFCVFLVSNLKESGPVMPKKLDRCTGCMHGIQSKWGCRWPSGYVIRLLPLRSGFEPRHCRLCLIKIALAVSKKSVVQFDSTEQRRFSPGTPVSSCTNTDTNILTVTSYCKNIYLTFVTS